MFSPLVVEETFKGEYVLVEPMTYKNYKVPKNFITDFATTPRLIHWIFKPDSKGYKKSSVLHDYLYTLRNMNRWKADLIFLEAMKHEQSLITDTWYRKLRWFITRWVFFGGVFVFGSIYKKGRLF